MDTNGKKLLKLFLKKLNNVAFEQLLSYKQRIGLKDQPTLRDMICDYYCGELRDVDLANDKTKVYIVQLWNKVGTREE